MKLLLNEDLEFAPTPSHNPWHNLLAAVAMKAVSDFCGRTSKKNYLTAKWFLCAAKHGVFHELGIHRRYLLKLMRSHVKDPQRRSDLEMAVAT